MVVDLTLITFISDELIALKCGLVLGWLLGSLTVVCGVSAGDGNNKVFATVVSLFILIGLLSLWFVCIVY